MGFEKEMLWTKGIMRGWKQVQQVNDAIWFTLQTLWAACSQMAEQGLEKASQVGGCGHGTGG
jgi:hypothetical protein